MRSGTKRPTSKCCAKPTHTSTSFFQPHFRAQRDSTRRQSELTSFHEERHQRMESQRSGKLDDNLKKRTNFG